MGIWRICGSVRCHVPEQLQVQYPSAKINRITPGWGGMDEKYTTYFLDPTDPLFMEIQKRYLTEQNNMYVLLMIPASALSTTASTLVSNMIGAGEKEKVMHTVNKIIRISLLLVLPVLVFSFIFPELFARIYTDDLSLVEASVPVIRVVSVAVAFFAVGNIVINGVSGTGATRVAFFMEVVTLFFYISYVYYTAIVRPTTVWVVWMSEFVYWTLGGALGYWYLLKGNWREKEI